MAPPSSHRVEDLLDDESSPEGHNSRNSEHDGPSTRHSRSQGHHHYPHHGHLPYSMPPYHGSPVMYYAGGAHDQHCHYCAPNGYGHHHAYGHESREQLAHYHPPHRDARSQQGNLPQHAGQPNYQPHYVAVNVQNDVSQAQQQHQNQAAVNKQISLKEKVINNTTKALDAILDRKVLLAAFVAFATPRLMAHVQTVSEKKKRKGITLNLGFGGF